MLWRARMTMPDRPGALATLAQECGAAGVNILAMQVFPGVGSVTDDFVLEVPPDWDADDVAALVERAGARAVVSHPCGEQALGDQPTRYVEAARAILAAPARFPDIVAALFDADADAEQTELPLSSDSMEMTVGDVSVRIHRAVPFTATEHARGATMAGLVSDVLQRAKDAAVPTPSLRPGTGTAPDYVVTSHRVTVEAAGAPVGQAVLAELVTPGCRRLALEVEPAWRRRGIGSRLLLEAARAAARLGDDELVLTTSADNPAVMPMVLGSGLRARVRLSGDVLSVRVPLRDLQSALH